MNQGRELAAALPLLHAAARRKVPADVADDLVQDAVLVYLSGARPDEPRLYLLGILRNLIRTHHRRGRREAAVRVGESCVPPHVGMPNVRQALRRLPTSSARWLLEHHVLGFTTREIAAREGASRGRILRGLEEASELLRGVLSEVE